MSDEPDELRESDESDERHEWTRSMSPSNDPHSSQNRNRPQRLRRTAALRALVRETRLHVEDLILPLFVEEGDGVSEISSMPGVFRRSVAESAVYAEHAAEMGIRAVILFGIPGNKDASGSQGWVENGIVQRAIQAIHERCPDLIVMADTCLCEYTDHGHCGILRDDHTIDVESTLEVLARVAVSQAGSGADVVAPSGMMDGMVGVIREALDSSGYADIPIMSYAVKYASAFYGPFRDAADGAPVFGDRRSHQMDPANAREALREARLDIEQGADFLMVKPALAYLDIVRSIRDSFPALPLVAYNVSGEYAMLKAAVQAGWLDEKAVVMESLLSMKRAGADLVITYYAEEVAQWLRKTTP
jgi:porphobilinogen synthase